MNFVNINLTIHVRPYLNLVVNHTPCHILILPLAVMIMIGSSKSSVRAISNCSAKVFQKVTLIFLLNDRQILRIKLVQFRK